MEESIINVEDALNLPNTIFIDVRSENEFLEANIPGSINIPILENEERVIVGTVYRKKSVEEAKSLGLRYASYKLEEIYSKILDLKKQYDNIVLYCWRGGMRSKSICDVLRTMKVGNVYKLEGGYKEYRKFVMDYIEHHVTDFKFVVLHGLTGVGKTIIINKLEKNNFSVMNLEKHARNSGSVFGDILFEGKSPSQKHFESLLFNNLYYNSKKYVVLESESKRIGSINLPNSFIEGMKEGYHILVKTSIKNRIENIYDDYVKESDGINEKLIRCIKHLNKRLGNKNVEMLINKINNGEYEFVIEFLIDNYYDPLYKYSIDKIENNDLVVDYQRIDDAVGEIGDFILEKFIEGSK